MAALNKQLVFAPGEVYKHVEIPIISRAIKGSKSFLVSFSNSPNLKGPMKVKVTILYTGTAIIYKTTLPFAFVSEQLLVQFDLHVSRV